MIRFFACLILVLLFAACESASPPRLTPAPTAPVIDGLDCVTVSDVVRVACVQDDPGGMILQAERATTLRLPEFTLTFDSTVWLNAERDTLAVLDGTALVAMDGTNRVINDGQQIALTADSEPQPYTPEMIPPRLLVVLPRSVVPSQTPEPTVPASLQDSGLLPTSTPDGCIPREDWKETYTVRAGDTLLRIAERHDVTLEELTEANCISVRALILPGDNLVVPIRVSPGVPDVTGHFYSDRASLPPGECTMIYWEIEAARRVTLNGEQVEASGEREVCPGQTTDYILRVTFTNNVQAVYTLTVPIVLELQP